MRCNKAARQLQLYLDEQLSLSQLRALEVHLNGCEACREELRMLEMVMHALDTPQTISEPAELHGQIMRRVASVAAQGRAAPVHAQPRPFSPWRPSLAELLAAILLATVATLGSILQQPSLRAVLPIANGHDSLSIAFLHILHTLTSLDSSTFTLLLWVAGTILGIFITLAFAGAEIRTRWFKAMMDHLPVR